jgi:hypothetical protein
MKLNFLKVFIITCYLPSFILGCSKSIEKTREQVWEETIEDYRACRKGFVFNDKKTCYDKAESKIDEYRANNGLRPMNTDQLRSDLSRAVGESY